MFKNYILHINNVKEYSRMYISVIISTCLKIYLKQNLWAIYFYTKSLKVF